MNLLNLSGVRITFITLALLGLTATPKVAHAQITALTNLVGLDLSGGLDSSYSLGWEFQVNSTIRVTSLGVYDYLGDGLASSHPVGIFRVSDQALLTSITVAPSDTLEGRYRYHSVDPTFLDAGTYRIAALYTVAQGDPFNISASSFDQASQISYVAPYAVNGTSLAFPINGASGFNGYFSANFQFDSVLVPEPATLAFLMLGISGGIVLRRRR